FGEGSTNAERLAELNRRDWLTPHHFEETIASLEDLIGTRHPILSELNSKEGLTASICSCIGLPVRQLICAALACCRIASDRNADRMHYLFGREAHEPPGTDDRAHAGDRGMIDAITEVVEDICDFAEHFIGKNCRRDEIAATPPLQLGRGLQSRNHVARMAKDVRLASKGIIEVQISDHSSIREYRDDRRPLSHSK